ncbi:aldehyde oxidase GLOX-like [Typha latifolia]|uniref:aldehyde oxidase GLOX-like n=1 Tax=Typha latifolia TaxID=4733 RepID=UPI003C2D7B5F
MMPPSRITIIPLLVFLLLITQSQEEEEVTVEEEGGGGTWLLLHPNIGICAMHMQLLPNNHLLVFDRTDFGPSNLSLPSTVPCSGDCTAHSALLDLASTSILPLSLLSDPWCSSAALLPNGSLLQSGGFNSGDRSLRLLSLPSSSWLELPSYLSVRRWYASNQLLPQGRVIILGGRRQFNYEFYPRNEEIPLFDFPFLEETTDANSEDNLYPFLHLLPDGALFVFANTRAVVFDPLAGGDRSLRRLPDIPDGVPRNYPSSGSSVLLPLRPSGGGGGTTRAEVFVCGGAPRGSYAAASGGTFLPASHTCGRIFPADPDPAWAMEEMPMPRVMGDMVLLPTGDVIIINGAGAGTAGWELAREPVLNPVLYRPDEPVGRRFEVLNPTGIPRLYHSSAALDFYGRVTVGGSNPHMGYVFAGVEFPTELSLEAFLPPYLDALYDGRRPRKLEAPAEVRYGGEVTVRFEVEEGVQEGAMVEVAAVAPGFATHAVGMNQRVVMLGLRRMEKVGEMGYVAEVVAPPSSEVAPPGYYMWFVVHDRVPSQAVWVQIG